MAEFSAYRGIIMRRLASAALLSLVGLALAGAAGAAGAAPRTFGSWIYNEYPDPMTDKIHGGAFARAGDEAEIGFKCDAPGPGSVYVQFISKHFMGSGADYSGRPVTVRIGQGEPWVSSGWRYGETDAVLVGRRNVATFLVSLKRAPKLTIRLIDYKGGQVDAIFDNLAGTFDALVKVRDLCADPE